MNSNFMASNLVTWNGAKSYDLNDVLVKLFFKSVRDISCQDYRSIAVNPGKKQQVETLNQDLEKLFDDAWAVDPLRALKFIFYLRDCREGKGEKKLFRALIRHLRVTNRGQHVLENMKHIPLFGSWKDLLLCFLGTEFETQALLMIANQLKIDKGLSHPSLCAKYAPSENGAFDVKHKAARQVAAALGVSLKVYRKKYLTMLRNKLNIVERNMCANDWETIKYETVPSIAGMNYKKAFSKHDESRYAEYLENVKRGKTKMNTAVLMPHQIIAPYLKPSKLQDETIEAQWISFLADRKKKLGNSKINVLPLIDISGSMFTKGHPQAIEVALSLGVLFSQLNNSQQYHRKFISFHTTPELILYPEGSLREQINFINESNVGGSTDFQKVFDLILNTATLSKVPAEDMPQILLVLSDMQFNQASVNTNTNWEMLNSKYEAANYQRPMIIFWNLNGRTIDFPVPDGNISNCMLLSGYNDSIVYSLLDFEAPNPKSIVIKALDADRYNDIALAK